MTPRLALLFRERLDMRRVLDLAALVPRPLMRGDDVGTVDEWRWDGPTPELAAWADRLDAPDLVRNADRIAADRA